MNIVSFSCCLLQASQGNRACATRKKFPYAWCVDVPHLSKNLLAPLPIHSKSGSVTQWYCYSLPLLRCWPNNRVQDPQAELACDAQPCTRRGPFMPAYWPKDSHWSAMFTSHLNDLVKLVGPTISCEGVNSWGRLFHVQNGRGPEH